MTVSTHHRYQRAKATTVSIPHRYKQAKAMTVLVEARPAPAKAMTVSDKQAAWPTGPGLGAHGQQRHNRLPNFARNLSWSFFETPQKHCNSNDANSMFEQATGELRAKLMGGGRAWPDNEATRRATNQHTRHHRCGGRRRDLPRCPWAVAGPGRASSRRAEQSSRRGRLAGGPPPTAQPGPARHTKQPGPAGHTKQPGPARHTKQPGPARSSRKS